MKLQMKLHENVSQALGCSEFSFMKGLSARARRRRVVALRPFLERAEAYVSAYTPAAV